MWAIWNENQCIEILVVILTLLKQLDGKSADYGTEFKTNQGSVGEKESVFQFFNSFVSTKIQEENQKDSEAQPENDITSVLKRIKNRLHSGLVESMKIDQDAEKEEYIGPSFSSLNPYFGNNTEFFKWMIVKLRVELHSNLQNCSPITKSGFRDWVDKHFNSYAGTIKGIGIIES